MIPNIVLLLILDFLSLLRYKVAPKIIKTIGGCAFPNVYALINKALWINPPSRFNWFFKKGITATNKDRKVLTRGGFV